MGKSDSEWEKMVAEAAQSVERQHQLGTQLGLWGEQVAPPVESKGVGRPKGAKNKGSTQLRDWLAAKGLAMPEDRLAQIAGLDVPDDAWTVAIKRAEMLMLFLGEGTKVKNYSPEKGHVYEPWTPSPDDKLAVFKVIYGAMLEANKALMPFVAPKASPDVQVTNAVQVIMPSAPSPDLAAQARDVSAPAPRLAGRMIPADLAYEMQQNQRVTEAAPRNSDAEIRTDKASD